MEDKLQELSEAFQAFKKNNDAQIAELKKGGSGNQYTEKLDTLNEHISKLEAEIKGMQTAANRGGQGGGDAEAQAQAELKKHQEHLNGYLRKGRFENELKAMSVNSDEDGGFFVTPAMSSEIVKKVYESSPIRQLASIQTISTDALEIIEDLDELQSGWVGETSSRPETNTAKIKKIIIPVHELYCQPKATQKFLDDGAINVEGWLQDKASEKFARDENTAFVAGSGVLKPRGFLAYDAGTGFGQIEQVESAVSATIAGDDMIELEFALKGEYKKNASFLAQRQTIKVLRKLKDTQGRYLWEPGLNGDAQPTFLGKPILEAADMQAYGAGNLSVAFGDFKAGYQIVDRIGMRVVRDIYTAKPYVLFYMTKRVGGGVKNFEAIKLLKVKA